MSAKQEWLELAERCEKAAGSDRELDCLIWASVQKHINPSALLESFRREFSVQTMIDDYTSHLDAVTALVSRELPSALYYVRLLWDGDGKAALGGIDIYTGEHPTRYAGLRHSGIAATAALALCAAFCRAMAERAEE